LDTFQNHPSRKFGHVPNHPRGKRRACAKLVCSRCEDSPVPLPTPSISEARGPRNHTHSGNRPSASWFFFFLYFSFSYPCPWRRARLGGPTTSTYSGWGQLRPVPTCKRRQRYVQATTLFLHG